MMTPHEIVLRALDVGLTVRLGDWPVRLANGRLITEMRAEPVGQPAYTKLVEVDWPLSLFIKLCAELSTEELVAIAADTGLNKIQQKKARARREGKL